MARLSKAAVAADKGQLRTAARLLRQQQLLPATERTADKLAELYQTDDAVHHGCGSIGTRAAMPNA